MVIVHQISYHPRRRGDHDAAEECTEEADDYYLCD